MKRAEGEHQETCSCDTDDQEGKDAYDFNVDSDVKACSGQEAVCEGIQDCVTEAHVQELRNKQGHALHLDTYRKHVACFKLTNTKSGSRVREHDYELCMRLLFGACDAAHWPPSEDAWETFLFELRPKVTSYERFRRVVFNFCRMMQERFPQSENLGYKYSVRTKKIYKLIKRQLGTGLSQVPGITQNEVCNVWRHIDQNCMKDVMQGTAFYLRCSLGGRRARSIASVKLRDITLCAHPCHLGSDRSECDLVLVPSLRIVFTDEKVEDIQGFRASVDNQSYTTDYGFWGVLGAGYWVYRLLVMRGCLQGGDPIKSIHCKPGAGLPVRAECADEYLLCDCRGDVSLGSMPVSVAMLSDWTRDVLVRCGSAPRGFSAHRLVLSFLMCWRTRGQESRTLR